MAITSTQQVRGGNETTVTVVSDLTGAVFFHWYIDGSWVGVSTAPARSFFLGLGDRVRVDVVDTTDPAFDPVANAPAGWPARRTLWWVRSVDADVRDYRVDQRKDAGAWSVIGLLHDDPGTWTYTLLTPRLDDLATYAWRVVPVDAAGNDGVPVVVGPETVVRTPDAPRFTAAFVPGTTRVTFDLAA